MQRYRIPSSRVALKLAATGASRLAITLILVAATIATATTARASLMVQLSNNGVNWVTEATSASGTTATFSTPNFNGFNVSVLSSGSNSPGTADLGLLLGSDMLITNNNRTSSTLYIRFGDTSFTAPTAPSLAVQSSIGGTVVVPGAGNQLIFQSYVNDDNGQNGQTGFTMGEQNVNITSAPFSDTDLALMTSLETPYSITQVVKVTLDPASAIGFQSSTTLTPSQIIVPEPAALILAGLGFLCPILPFKRSRC